MKTNEILKVLKEIKENAPPMIDDENFVKVIFYADGSGHVELNGRRIFSFIENFGEFQKGYSNWKNK